MNTLMRTNSNKYRERIFARILDMIDTDGTPLEDVELTNREKVEFLLATFSDEFSHEKRRTPNHQQRLAGWLQGLPSAINAPFMNHQILKFAAEVHDIDKVPPGKEDVILEKWWNHLAFMILKLYERETGESYNG